MAYGLNASSCNPLIICYYFGILMMALLSLRNHDRNASACHACDGSGASSVLPNFYKHNNSITLLTAFMVIRVVSLFPRCFAHSLRQIAESLLIQLGSDAARRWAQRGIATRSSNYMYKWVTREWQGAFTERRGKGKAARKAASGRIV